LIERSAGVADIWCIARRTDKQIDPTCMQSSEVWTGTTFGLAAAMYQEGLVDEAWRTAFGVFRCTYQDYGYWFQTPEAWDEYGNYRAISYMRPLAIWAIEWARRVVPTLKVESLSVQRDDSDLAFGLFERSVENSSDRAGRRRRASGDSPAFEPNYATNEPVPDLASISIPSVAVAPSITEPAVTTTTSLSLAETTPPGQTAFAGIATSNSQADVIEFS
jgi:hypothetical protein